MIRQSHRHARTLWRLLCPQALLYTEMAVADAVVRRGGHAHLYEPGQNPVALQLAGCDPATLAQAASIGEQLGYDEINFNCGCPSKKVVAGRFGACLMAHPKLVADCVAAMAAACRLPITVKCRTAIDDLEPADCLFDFAAQVHAAGCAKLVVHVRKAWLSGLNPKQNRTRPPLTPQFALDVKRQMPELCVITNGGIDSVASADERAVGVDGVMLGRAIVARPALLAQFAVDWFGRPPADPDAIVSAYLDYCARKLETGEHPRRLLCPLSAYAAGRVGARSFRRAIDAASISGDLQSVQTSWQ